MLLNLDGHAGSPVPPCSIHPWRLLRRQFGYDVPRDICENFWDATESVFPKKHRRIEKEYKNAPAYKQHEEFFVYALHDALVRGSFEKIDPYLDELGIHYVDKLLNEFGYDRQREGQARISGKGEPEWIRIYRERSNPRLQQEGEGTSGRGDEGRRGEGDVAPRGDNTSYSLKRRRNRDDYTDEDRADAAAQKMVDDAARAAGMATDENGKPIDLYHGTNRFGFTIFDRIKSRVGAFFTSTRRNVAANYAGDDHHAPVRKINNGYMQDDSQEGILNNARSVFDQDWKMATEEQKGTIVTKVEAEARKIADEIDKRRVETENLPADDELDIFNAVAWVEDLFYTVAYAKENGNEGEELYRLVQRESISPNRCFFVLSCACVHEKMG